MSKPSKTEAQRLLEVLGVKIEELQKEIKQMEAKSTCPFWYEFFDDEEGDDCLYINGLRLCDCLEVCPSNSDAWCYKKIEVGVKKEKDSEIINELKEMLDKYADLRCDNCDVCEH